METIVSGTWYPAENRRIDIEARKSAWDSVGGGVGTLVLGGVSQQVGSAVVSPVASNIIGSVVGHAAGAKIGGAIGTVIFPGIGTLAGLWLGTWGARMVREVDWEQAWDTVETWLDTL